MVSIQTEIAVRREADVVADVVEKYLLPHQPSDYRIVVHRDHIHKAGRWLVEVGIEPAGKDVPADDFIGRFSAANLDMDRELPRFARLTQMLPQPGEVL